MKYFAEGKRKFNEKNKNKNNTRAYANNVSPFKEASPTCSPEGF